MKYLTKSVGGTTNIFLRVLVPRDRERVQERYVARNLGVRGLL